MMRRRLAALSLLTLAVTSAHAAVSWTYASSPHFEVYTTAGERRAREALADFERVHAFFASFLKLPASSDLPTRLIVFSGEKEYAPYRPNEFATAFYQPGPDRDYIVMRSLDGDGYPVVVHEYAHLVMRRSGHDYPRWLGEGLAEFFSTMTPQGSGISIGRVPLGRLHYLKSGAKLLPLDRLLAVTRDSVEYNTKAHAGLFYSQSWAFTHMLISDERYRPAFDRFLAAVQQGKPAAEALVAVFGRSIEILQKDLEGYIRRDSYRYITTTVLMPKATAFPARTATAFEAGLVGANLLALNQQRQGDADAAFAALAREQPDDVSLLESRGYFELRRRRVAEARSHFARAVEGGSRNGRMYADYALLLSAAEDERAAALLSTAVLLAPDDVDVRVSLARSLLRRQRAADALIALGEIKAVPVDSAYLFFQVVANANAQLGHLETARAAAAKVIEVARPGSEMSFAVQFAKSIEVMADRPRAASPSPRAADPAAAERFVDGRLTNMACGSGPALLEIVVSDSTLRLVLDDPFSVKLLSLGTPPARLTCGPQDRAVRVGYLPVTDDVRKTVGNIRSLEFR